MGDAQTSASDTEEKGKPPTQKSDVISMAAYKKLQADLQKANDSLKEFRAKAREGQSAEAQLAELQEELAEAQRKIKVQDLKAGAPKELHDYIDKQLAKGRDLDEEDIQDLVDRLPKNESNEDPKSKDKGAKKEESTEAGKEKSGVRNSAPNTPNEDQDVEDFLKKTNVKDALGL